MRGRRQDSRHMRVQNEQASLDQPNGGQLEFLADENKLAAVGRIDNFIGSEGLEDPRGEIVAQILGDLIH